MSTMVNLANWISRAFASPGVKLDEKMSNYSSDSERSRGIYKLQVAGKWSESKKMSCYAILKNLYGAKMDVILTISFKITAEIDFADKVYRLCKAHVILFSRRREMRRHCFFTVNSSVNAAWSYWTSLLAEVPWITH